MPGSVRYPSAAFNAYRETLRRRCSSPVRHRQQPRWGGGVLAREQAARNVEWIGARWTAGDNGAGKEPASDVLDGLMANATPAAARPTLT
jgi:hypothetical protein